MEAGASGALGNAAVAERPVLSNPSVVAGNSAGEVVKTSASAVASAANDAYFAAGGWFADAARAATPPITPSSASKISLIGIAAGLGTLGAWRMVQRRRQKLRKTADRS